MQQRENLPIPSDIGVYQSINPNMCMALTMAGYFIKEADTCIPVSLLDTVPIYECMRKGNDYAKKLEMGNSSDKPVFDLIDAGDRLRPVLSPKVTTLSNILSTFSIDTMSNALACIITFESNDVLCLVGAGTFGYYIIDTSNRIFTHIASPEYDVEHYTTERGKIIACQMYEYASNPKPSTAEPVEKKRKVAAPKRTLTTPTIAAMAVTE